MEFIETKGFSKIREEYLNDDEFQLIQAFLIEYPDAGDIIKGSGGIRKVRWASRGKGKSGGLRVIYYWITADDQILFLTAYRKNEMVDLPQSAVKEMKKIIQGS